MKYTAALDQNDWTIMNLFMVLPVKFHNIVDDISSPSGFSL
jgi:hypothetical protein